jgi:hypothetical protein
MYGDDVNVYGKLHKGKKQFGHSGVRFAAIIGDGCEVGGKRYWFDPDGKPYDLDALKELRKEYKHVVGCGSCMKAAAGACTACATGCETSANTFRCY